jgi:GxxExxY protein
VVEEEPAAPYCLPQRKENSEISQSLKNILCVNSINFFLCGRQNDGRRPLALYIRVNSPFKNQENSLRKRGKSPFFPFRIIKNLHSMTRDQINNTGAIILDASITVHKEFGPGLLESVYRLALKRELELRGLDVKMHVNVDLLYKDQNLGKCYEIDLLVEDEIIIETKSCDKIIPLNISQVITYLKLSNKNLGYLINFNVPLLKEGFRRIVYKF